jgi:hypothetical protein
VGLRPAALLLTLLGLTACGGSNDGALSKPATLDELAQGHGTEVALTPGTRDLSPGAVRFTFLVLDDHGRSIERPTAKVWIAREQHGVPFLQATARLVPTGIAASDHAHAPSAKDGFSDPLEVDASGIYVLNTRIDQPGTYWLLARPAGVTRLQAVGNLIVQPRTAAPALGAKAPASDTPTLGEAPIGSLTTMVPPDRALLRYSIADSLRAHKPFVVTFATPAFCQSRICGPVVDIVDQVRRDFASSDVRFMHVEIYAGNNPKNGVNRWVRQWNLPSEPFTFLVGRDGRIKAKFEGVVSVAELRAAVRRTLVVR